MLQKLTTTVMISGIDARHLGVLMLSVVACGYDVRTRHIPNYLTFGGAAAALTYGLIHVGAGGIATGVLGWLTGFALFLPFFLLRGMGAGDVKLLACLGAWLGPEPAMWMALYAAIAGGVMAVIVALATGYLRQAVSNVSALLLFWRAVGISPLPELTLAEATGPRLPYAIPIATGAMAVIWLQLQ